MSQTSSKEVSNAPRTKEEQLKQFLYVEAHRPGGDPSQILETLEDIINDEAWIKLGKSFSAFISEDYPEGIGVSKEDFETIVFNLSHRYESSNPEMHQRMERVRERVGEELGGEARVKPPRRPTKEEQDKPDQVRDNTSYGNSRDYVLGRLNRDVDDKKDQLEEAQYREIHNLLSRRKISVREAKKRAGYGGQQKTITIPADPQAAAKRLLRHFDAEELIAAIRNVDAPS